MSNMSVPPPSPNPHEQAAILVARAQAGDHAAFSELVRRYRARIFALALHLTGTEAEADDVTQEVFWGAYRALPQFAGRSEFFTWVYRMAVNRSLNARRNRRRRGEEPMDDPRVARAVAVDAGGDPARAAELRQTYSRLLGALDRLPTAMRTTVVLVALQGLAHGEAAIVQGCSPGTIAWRMHMAREQLGKAMQSLRPRRPTPVAVPAPDVSSELRELLQACGLPVLAPS
ncbi:MAG: sigma-70 family RNA polymerase sigma factor [Deltaproteobacteria bacterium]|nr:sigma-70 family RNA polymerase sigma factor [Deltaproteobacteria bacterium]